MDSGRRVWNVFVELTTKSITHANGLIVGLKYKLGLSEDAAGVDPDLLCAYRHLKKWYYRFATWLLVGRKFDAKIDPFEVHYLDPDSITTAITDITVHEWSTTEGMISEVISGDWDKQTVRFRDGDIYRAISDRYENDKEWEETKFFRRIRTEIESGKTKWGCETVDEFEQRCEVIDELVEFIDEYGYLTQDQLCRVLREPNQVDSLPAPPSLSEILVSVSRDGEYVFVDGRHRLAIAKTLDIEKVPVQVKARHEKWQQKRERIINDEEIKSKSHPDLLGL